MVLVILALAAALPAAPRAGDELPTPTGRIEFSGWVGGIGIGYTSLDGTLYLGDERYAVSIVSMEAPEVGLAYVRGSGDVYDVTDVRAVQGRYRAFLYSGSVGAGGHGMRFENASGAYMETSAMAYGLNLAFGPGGLRVFVHGMEGR